MATNSMRDIPYPRREHRHNRIGWLRASVLGANDGIITVSSLIYAVASASGGSGAHLPLVATAGLASGTLAMAAGEYVSVRSQADAEAAELEVERDHLHLDFDAERDELAAIYRERGLDTGLAQAVATQLMAHDALGAHARDELGLSGTLRARPVLAALSSGLSFLVGGTLPLIVALGAPPAHVRLMTALGSLLALGLLGGIAAVAGGADPRVGATRVIVWGALSMAVAALVGALLGTAGLG